MLKKIHQSHRAAEYCLRFAREAVFWPNMSKDIETFCQMCPTCAQYGKQATTEPMLSHPTPTLPWQFVSQDIFEFEQKQYLVTVDHFSDFYELDPLINTQSTTIVEITKAHFARHGIPLRCLTDNGPQFISNDYKKFAQTYGFEHITSSPYWSRSNGKAEAAVHDAKSTLKKSHDVYLALLNIRNTPPRGYSFSPAQRLMGRRTCSTLPTSENPFKPEPADPSTVSSEITLRREASKSQYDKYAHPPLLPLPLGSHAYAKPRPSQRGAPWLYGRIINNPSPRDIELNPGPANDYMYMLLQSRLAQQGLSTLDVGGAGSPCDSKVGLDRRTFVFKHAIQILNDGDLSNKVATEVVGFLLMELDAFPGRTLAELADMFINAIKSGSLSNGKSLELFPKVLSAVAAKDFIPMPGDCGGEMAGQEYKRHLLNTLCSSRWDPQCAIHLAAVFRDVPMTSDELRFVMEKIVRAMKDLDLQELPPLVYQLLLLSTKGHKQLVLEGVTCFFNNLDETCRKEDKEDSSEVQTVSKDQLRHMQGTVILHITFAVKQDQDLGKEFIKYLKAHQSTPGVVLTPFNVALALSIAQIHRFEETIFDFLKSAVLRSFKDEDRREQSKWVRENIPACPSVQDQVLETVQNSLFGWDHVTQGLVQLGFTLMDAFGPKVFGMLYKLYMYMR
ncbi:hypothetical protein ACROYT_G005175 [Oculina patagonica]